MSNVDGDIAAEQFCICKSRDFFLFFAFFILFHFGELLSSHF